MEGKKTSVQASDNQVIVLTKVWTPLYCRVMASSFLTIFFFLPILQEKKKFKKIVDLSICYGLNVCVSPNFYVETPTLKVMVSGGGAFGSNYFRWGPEGVAPMMGLSFLLKKEETRQLESKLPLPFSSLLPCEDTVKRQLSMNPEVGPHQEANLPGTLTLDFPASTPVRNKCLLFNPPSPWNFVITASRVS